ncbi:MAG: matrixin family metalloprotease, partial [Nitrososphaerales archaeon]
MKTFISKSIKILLISLSFCYSSIVGQLIKLEIEQISIKSHTIIKGLVLGKRTVFEEDQKSIVTIVNFKVIETIKGVPKITEQVIIPGGVVNNLGIFVSHTPQFYIGEEVVVFIKNDYKGRPTITGWTQGKFQIINENIFYESSEIYVDEFIFELKNFVQSGEKGKLKINLTNNGPDSPLATPSISSISPNTGPALRPYLINPNNAFSPGERGTIIDIYGSNFGSSQGASFVKFYHDGTDPANAQYYLLWTDTHIQCKVPGRNSLNASSGLVYVVTSNGTSNGVQFNVKFATPNKKFLTPQITFYVNQNGTPDTGGEFSAIQNSLQTWNNVNHSNLSFVYGGTTSRTPQSFDNYNDVGWIENTWTYEDNALAVNVVRFSALESSIEVYESDIHFNGYNHSWTTSGQTGSYDVQNISTHELGHALYLQDLYGNADGEKTMYGYAYLNETNKRSLETDDISGAVYLYPDEFTLELKNNFEFDTENNGQLTVKNLTQSTNTIQYNSPINQTVYWSTNFEVTAYSQITVNGRLYNLVGWTDNYFGPNPRTITPTSNTTYTALYKYPHYSNSTSAFANNNQRKFIRSYNGHLHIVYESMNKVWYERSTNNGQTWEIMNGGKPIYGGIATHPSIDYYPGSNDVIIVYNKDEYEIAAQYYENGVFKCESIVSNSGWVNENSKPVIASTYTRLIVAWNEMGYILYRLGQKIYTPNHDFHWYFDPRVISDPLETDKNNPTIATSKLQAIGFWLAWDRNQSAIQFVNLDLIDNDEDIQQSGIYTYGQAGFSKNEQPSISVMPNNDYRISWFGSNGGSKQVVTYFNYQFYIFGTNLSSHSMSVTDDGKSIITYGDQNGSNNKFRQIWYFTLDKNLNTTGKQTHLSNGSSLSNMYAMSFQNATLPYSFSMSANLGSLPKVTETPISSGRKGIVAGDSTEFYFVLGDVTLNGNVINYIPTGRNPDFSRIDTLNYFLSTEQFRLNNSSEFGFSIQYGVTDSLKAVQELSENEYVKFKLQLVDAITDQVLGEYTMVTFTKQNIIPQYTESFLINTNGIGNKKVRLRFIVEENINCKYAMANIHADESIL